MRSFRTTWDTSKYGSGDPSPLGNYPRNSHFNEDLEESDDQEWNMHDKLMQPDNNCRRFMRKYKHAEERHMHYKAKWKKIYKAKEESENVFLRQIEQLTKQHDKDVEKIRKLEAELAHYRFAHLSGTNAYHFAMPLSTHAQNRSSFMPTLPPLPSSTATPSTSAVESITGADSISDSKWKMYARGLPSSRNVVRPRILAFRGGVVPLFANERGRGLSQLRDSVYEEEVPPEELEAVANVADQRHESEWQRDRLANRNVSSFYECISNGVMDMNAASRLVFTQKQRRTYNPSVYEEFIRSESASRIDSFSFDGLEGQNGINLELRLIANQIQVDILSSKIGKVTRILEICNNKEHPKKKIRISVRNTTKSWDMDGPQPFAKVCLNEIVMDYQYRSRDNAFQMFTSFYRFLLQKITHPAYRIQEYAIRKNGRGGRDRSLKNLPRTIEVMLLDFLEDLIGYGTEEAQAGEKCGERLAYRAEMFKALQAALRDIRSYGYDHVEGKFIPSSRKSKRAEPAMRIVEDVEDEE